MKNLYKYTAAILLAFFILSSSVITTLAMKFTYRFQNDINQVEYNLSRETINNNYDNLIDYMFKSNSAKLEFKGLPMSTFGEIHFKEVKDIFRFFYIGMFISLLLVLILGFILIKKYKNPNFLKIGSILVFVIPLILSLPLIIDFSNTFILFHKIAFSNDYWIFDPAKDPIIRYLPESLFFINAIIILVLIVVQTAIAMLFYKSFKAKAMN